ncbi:MAG TPA: pyridoxamine 5'-phosphate oxidase family protein [Chryseolinea sp.]|nr:pyridoxamine 5'-phosphate oxidase family protein [Flavobacteriales bacterium]HPM32518.1 pyridoxamine 5'-phosphate oxidase family protein [Chryseolinea sp.]
MIGTLNKLQIDFLLRSELLGRIGCSADGITYVIPITYVYDGKYILAHTREGTKIEMMRKNANVCFEVDRIQDMANWQSVIIQGKYEELSGKKAEDTVQLLVNRMHPFASSETMVPRYALAQHKTPLAQDSRMIVFRIRIVEATGRFEKK